MKIALMTFFYAHNVGANLQAYALKTIMERLGYDVLLVNYRNKNIIEQHCSVNLPKLKLISKHWLKPTNWGELVKTIRRNQYAKTAWARRWKVFNDEILNLFGDVGDAITFDKLSNIEVDAFVSGSDQIWSRGITGGFDKAYFLDFSTNARKIAYAASMDKFKMPTGKLQEFTRLIGNYTAISTRERYVAKNIKTVTNKQITAMLDPSLLLNSEDYKTLMCKDVLETQKFIFVYCQAENSEILKAADKIAEKLGAMIIELHNFELKELRERNVVTEVGYSKFLWYMEHAEFVVTNSFHGVCFSITYKKQFYAVYKNGSNHRVQDLLERLNITDRHIFDVNSFSADSTIDYSTIYYRLENEREHSIFFLQTAISGDTGL